MPENYRVRIRQGDFEVEVESTDRKYVDVKLKEVISKGPQSEGLAGKPKSAGSRKGTKRASSTKVNQNNAESSLADVVAITAAINEAENHDAIEEQILDKKGILERIMLCLFFAGEVDGPDELTTGEIETITNQLNIRVSKSNVGTRIRNNMKYLEIIYITNQTCYTPL